MRATEGGVTQIKVYSSTRLVTNECKTKLMKINRKITNLEQHLMKNGQVFEGTRNFIYLDALIDSKKFNK